MSATQPQRVVMLSLHTSPMAQAGSGDAGGMNVYVNLFSAALASRGVEVDLVTTDAENPVEDNQLKHLPDGRRLITLKLPDQARENKGAMLAHLPVLAAAAVQILQETSTTAVDVVHSHYWISGQMGVEVARALDVPLVHTMHTIGLVKQQRDPQAQEDARRIASECRIAECATVLTANTTEEAQELTSTLHVPPHRIHEVPPGVDLSVFRPPASPDPRLKPLGTRRLKLGFAGRLQPHKGPQILIAALGLLHREHPDVRVELTVAGAQSGPQMLDLKQLAEAEGVSELLTLKPALPHQDLAKFLGSCDAVLMPSFSESFGLVALEAMACGTPVLAHHVGGLGHLVIHEETGELIDNLTPGMWAKAIARLENRRRHENGVESQWQQWSKKAHEVAQNFSWQHTAQRALDAYAAASFSWNSGNAMLSSTCR